VADGLAITVKLQMTYSSFDPCQGTKVKVTGSKEAEARRDSGCEHG
jgi:hypothetical protein